MCNLSTDGAEGRSLRRDAGGFYFQEQCSSGAFALSAKLACPAHTGGAGGDFFVTSPSTVRAPAPLLCLSRVECIGVSGLGLGNCAYPANRFFAAFKCRRTNCCAY